MSTDLASRRDFISQCLGRLTARAVDDAIRVAYRKRTGLAFNKHQDADALTVEEVGYTWTVYLEGQPLVRLSWDAGGYTEDMNAAGWPFLSGPRLEAAYIALPTEEESLRQEEESRHV